jgi:hypothetical protein
MCGAIPQLLHLERTGTIWPLPLPCKWLSIVFSGRLSQDYPLNYFLYVGSLYKDDTSTSHYVGYFLLVTSQQGTMWSKATDKLIWILFQHSPRGMDQTHTNLQYSHIPGWDMYLRLLEPYREAIHSDSTLRTYLLPCTFVFQCHSVVQLLAVANTGSFSI